jgi:hypothetical protein
MAAGEGRTHMELGTMDEGTQSTAEGGNQGSTIPELHPTAHPHRDLFLYPNPGMTYLPCCA